ncbi:MAG: hypothetical protein J3K34DRAFT_464423, partial [Monoraphidium minutum]
AYGPEPDGGRRRGGPSSSGGAPPGGSGGGASGGGGGGAGWVLLKRREVDSGPNAALEISRSGRLLALGQAEGSLLVADARSLHVLASEPRASMVFVTRVAFSDDDGAALAVGGDANAFVLPMRSGGGGGGGGGGCGSVCAALLFLVVAIAAGAAFLFQVQPERAAQALELIEALQQHEAARRAAELLAPALARLRPAAAAGAEAAAPHVARAAAQLGRLVGGGPRDEL